MSWQNVDDARGKRRIPREGDSLRRLHALFDAAAQVAAHARAQWIAENVADPHERDELARLLAADDGAGGFLDTPAGEHASRLTEGEEAKPEGLLGQRIGAFRLVRLLGKGGMAAVFLGEREGDDFRQHVAVKLLRRGLYSEIEQRLFQRERQVLANLSHPNIARLFDGGVTESGIPYLVMEYVDGVPVTRYAQDRGLDLRGRLDLFLIVCQAVEAAHRALIVHRDIKPSNILVSTDGNVKLLDFGIAKLLEDDIEGLTIGVFTPEYAAPEQIGAGAITTATDVYALGVLLHELLTGVRPARNPLRRPSSIAVGAARKNADPQRSSALASMQHFLRGDLDNIILKALAQEPEQRYASAGALADDIKRYLGGQPIAAHPPSTWYRASKFVSRHRGGVLATAALLAAVLAGLALALWQANVARHQARIARQEATHAARVRDFLVSIFEAAGADLPKDRRPSVQELVEQATTRLSAKSSLPDALRADLLLTLAKVARSIGDYDHALALLDRVDPLLVGADQPRADPARQAEWRTAKVTRAAVLADKSQNADAIALLEPLKVGLLSQHDETAVQGLVTLGIALRSAGRVDEGLHLLREAVTIAGNETDAMPDALLRASIFEASELMNTQHFREGLDRANAALALWRQRGEPPSQSIIRLYSAIAIADEAIGDIPHAEAAYKEAIALGDEFFDKPNPAAAWNIGIYGTFLVAQGRLDEAEPYIRRGLEMRRAVFGDADPRTISGFAGMAKLFIARQDYAQAENWMTQGIDICRAHAIHDVACPRALAIRALVYGRTNRLADAERDIREALDLQRTFDGDSSPAYAYILDDLVVVQISEHDYEHAIATADQSLAIYHAAKGGLMQTVLLTRFNRAQALFELKRNDESLAEILEIEPQYAKLAPSGTARFAMLALKARALDRAHRNDEAGDAARAALSVPNKATPELHDEVARIAGAGAQTSH